MMMLKTTGDAEALKAAYDRSARERAGEHARGEEWGIPKAALLHVCAFSDDAMYIFDVFRDSEIQQNLIHNRQALPEHLRPVTGAISSSASHRALSNNESLQDRFTRDSTLLRVRACSSAQPWFTGRAAERVVAVRLICS
jgi:hypothetical protein